LWGIYLYSFLWQQRLYFACKEAISFCDSINIVLQPTSLRARLHACGIYKNQEIEIYWYGGIFGESSNVIINGQSQQLELLRTKNLIERCINPNNINEEVIVHSGPISKPQNE
jgi:hypothetical protein